MGSNISSLKTIKQNEYLLKLVGPQNITIDDSKYWDDFLSFTSHGWLNSICSDRSFMDENVLPLISKWMENNASSCNLGSTIEIFVQKVAILKKNSQNEIGYNVAIWHAYNLMFIMRNMFKFMVELLTEDNVIKNCKTLNKSLEKVDSLPSSEENNGLMMIESFLNALIEILVDIKIDDLTYNLHVESCKTFLVLLSIQMFFTRPSVKSVIYTIVMQKKCSIHALLLTKTLLNNFIQQTLAPVPPSGSIIFGLASNFWSVVTLGYGNKKTEEDLIKEAVLARESLLLLLVLTNHFTKESNINPYREALFQCTDSNATDFMGNGNAANHQQTANQTTLNNGFKIEFSKLYKTLCTTLNDDQTTLLMYMMLHQNSHFKTFVLSRTTDLDQFVVPVLKILYNSLDRNSHHIYMSLIILLVLSEDNLFNTIVHDIVVRNVLWYTERNLNEISLGGLIILVIVRTIHFNMSRSRDRFLHTNLCATLANMSNHFKHLNTYVCQKLVNLFEKISKKYFKLQLEAGEATSKINGITDHQVSNEGDSVNENNAVGEAVIQATESFKDLTLFEEVLRTILEIINASLTKNMLANPNLIYTLLYNRKVFDPFLGNLSFQDIIVNIDTVLTYFSGRIESSSSAQQQAERVLSVEEIYEIIKQSSLNWPKEKMKKFPELMFRYVEDEQPEDFFIPYIWTLVFRCSDIDWSSKNILLFNPVRNT